MVNGVQGKWIPIENADIPENMSADPNHPFIGSDGKYYYADPMMGQQAAGSYPSPITANQNNAIPTPSSIVQLPPIVQPISLVPYTTQNQPLLQYDPNYRPEIPDTATPEPAYKRNPYPVISTFVALLSLGAIVVACLLAIWNDSTALMAIKSFITDGALTEILNGNMDGLFGAIVCAAYALSALFAVIVLLQSLICLGKSKALPKFNVLTLLSLLFSVAGIAIMFWKQGEGLFTINLGAYVYSALLLVALLFTLGINKNAMVIDYAASKQTFIK